MDDMNGAWVSNEDLNNIAMYGMITGLDPDREAKIKSCGCKSCEVAAAVLRLVGDRMRCIVEADDALKN